MNVSDYGMLMSNNPTGFMEPPQLKWPRWPNAVLVAALSHAAQPRSHIDEVIHALAIRQIGQMP
jgi:hypothetical protein